ncbi:MAG: 4-carboxymuconolactone decarboxylase [Candidatus Tectomicrobia bacterium]|uniref:4-carboxymuconolactone decarboxylase n=1 Tax=Tectimicrobiota bacterium TaxID=2528274 RepID=A0A937W352_UNCTE|nr:4-carboxymuconolactone decarboxylase [Candidatus Tectomicrobia bacterium]
MTAHTNLSESKDDIMAKSELYEQGVALRNQLMGEAFAARMQQQVATNPTLQKFRELTAETVFGALWTRPGLDLKTRTLICVVSDTAMGRDPELALHLRMALRQGWTEDELTEVLLHMLGYIGAPLVREAMLTASRVFQEVRQENGA